MTAAVADRHRLDLVVRHVDRGHADSLLQVRDLRPHLEAEARVEVRERLVHQEHLRLAHDRASHRHALALAARQPPRLAIELRLEPEQARNLPCPSPAFLGRHLGDLEREAMFSATVMCG